MKPESGNPVPEDRPETSETEPTKEEVVDAFVGEAPTKEEIESAFTGNTGPSNSDDQVDAKKKNLHDILFSAATAILVTIIGGALYSLMTFGDLSSVLSLIPGGNDHTKILSISPTAIEDGILSNNSHFTIKTENASIEKLKEVLVLDPAIDYDLKEVKPGIEYELTPTSTLADNTVFGFNSMNGPIVSYKWAYQTKKALSVSKVYPANGANYVSEDSVIEINFSYPEVEGIKDHFRISPSVDGTFAKTDRGWRFSPSAPLSADTTYEITITAGLTVGEETMAEDFHSSFSTHSRTVSSQDSRDYYITLDKITTFHPADFPSIVVSASDFSNASHFTVEKISSADEYIKYLKGESVQGESLGRKEFEMIPASDYDYHKRLILKETLPAGYYIFRLKSADDANILTANIQVNNLDAYSFESERDLIFWVAENGELKQGAKINFKGNDYYTDDNGLLRIDGFSDFSKNIDYAKVGDDSNPLIIGLNNYKNDLYPTGFIYTDRPLYKPTDTVKIWGYIPLSFFADAPDMSKFSLSLNSDWSNTNVVFKQSIVINSDGTFSADLSLDNIKDMPWAYLRVTYNDASIATRNISIEDYTLENYTYEVIMPKNYTIAGEPMNFKVKVSHVTGFPAANKDLVITYDKHDYYGTTNAYGEASFSLPTERTYSLESSPSVYLNNYFEIKSAGAEYNKYSTSACFFIFKTNLNLNIKQNEATNTLNITAKNLDLTREAEYGYYSRALDSSNYSGPATLKVYEHKTVRVQTGTSYDQYTKQNVPVYNITTTSEVIATETIDIRDGKYDYHYSTDYKPSTENTYYSYSVQVSATDSMNRPSTSYNTYYRYGYYSGSGSCNCSRFKAVHSYDDFYGYGYEDYYNDTSIHLSAHYALYRFGLRDTNGITNYNVGDKLSLGLYDANGESVENTGKVLTIGYKERIVSANISDSDTFDYDFDYNLYPGAKFIGAYFKDGKFYRIAPNYYDYDATNANLSVSIETDKESYEPGDHVKAKVIITYPDGSRADSGKVNLSVVNDAVFNGASDSTGILDSVYANKTIKGYSMSTFRDFELGEAGGGKGAAGGARSNFGDTIFFGEKTFENGEAEFEFDLNDIITSFRFTAIAVRPSDIIYAGVGTKKIGSFLPLSISTVMPKKVKDTDDLVLNATSPVSGSNTIHYTFEVKDTDKHGEATGQLGENVYANLGKLPLGNYTVRISGHDDAGNEDAMEFPVEIVETAQEVSIKQTMDLSEVKSITPVKNPIIVELYSKDAKKYIDYLDKLEGNLTERLDTQIAYYKAGEIHDSLYKESSSIKAPDFSMYLTDNGVLRPLINAEGDYTLTALANFYARDYFDLKPVNYSVEINDEMSIALEKLLVLASFREPVLFDLNAIDRDDLSDQDRIVLGLAYAFLGDYDSASSLYKLIDYSDIHGDLYAVLATMLEKNKAASYIDRVVIENPTADYLDFAIISFFNNNEAELSQKNTIDIVRPEGTERIEFNGLAIEKRIFSSDSLSTLEFKTSSNDLYATYYYQGRISDLADSTTDISAHISGATSVGQTANLVLDISNLQGEERNGEINIALPVGLKFSATFSSDTGLYLSRNNNEYVKLNLNKHYTSNEIQIPLYVAAPGNYELEPIIFVHDGKYHLSNSVDVTLNK